MSLAARTALYFKHMISAKFIFTPAPINADEIRFISDSFAKLGTVEYFSVEKAKHTQPNLFGQSVTVMLNSSLQFSQLDPLTGIDTTVALSGEQLKLRQQRLHEKLRRIIGLPRYSYIENDKRYFAGDIQVPFKHTLLPNASQFTKQYRMSTSTIQTPFVFLEEGDKEAVTKSIRHNFQKYHKIQLVFVEDGLHGLHLLGGGALDTSVKIDDDMIVRTEEILDLEAMPNMRIARTKENGFNGFFSKPKPKV